MCVCVGGGGDLLPTRVKCDRLCDLFSTKSAPYPILAVPTFQKQQMVALCLLDRASS